MTANQEDDLVGRLDLTPDPRILEVLGKIPYQPWQCLAELVDNSFDELLADQHRDLAEVGAVYVTVPRPNGNDEDAQVTVFDSGSGMGREDLERALRAGYTGKTGLGTLGLFGMGFNISTARLGNRTEVRTTRAGDSHWLIAEINLREMQRRGSFDVPVRRSEKPNAADHGTRIIVQDLNKEMLDTLRRPATITSIRRRLGRVYSYVLRGTTPIPGVPDEALVGRGIALYLNNTRIEPWLPCIWSESRVVNYRGAEVSAVQPIYHELTDAYACVRCGYWQHNYNSGHCLTCDGDGLERRHRLIHGWLGVQRYLHESRFGIDFIRNGRTILMDDKDLFTWEDPETGEKYLEYPIEIPSRDGRLVGEIHLDHVPVDYQKTDFKRETPEWRDAVIYLRGIGPMREKKAKERNYAENRSPLGTLFKPFQNNDPGLRYLIPGDGFHATHETARKWGELFHKRLPEFQTDEKWYEAAKRHGELKTERESGRPARGRADPPSSLGNRTGLGPLPTVQPTKAPGSALTPIGDPGNRTTRPSPGETEDERFERYRKDAHEVYDLAGEVAVAGIGKRQVRVFDTTADLVNGAGKAVPVISRATTGMNLEVYVNGEHQVFREYGRDPRDYAIVEIAQVLKAIANADVPLLAMAAEVTSQFPDQRTTPTSLHDRASTVVARIRDLMGPIVMSRAAEMWSILPGERKVAAEREAARSGSPVDWREATRDGRFAYYLDCAAIATLVRHEPGAFLDRTVFTTSWAGWSDAEARDRQVSQVLRLLDTIGEFLADLGTKSRNDLALTRLSIDMLDQLVSRTG